MEWNEFVKALLSVVVSTVLPSFAVFLGYQLDKFVQSKVSKDKQMQIDKIVHASVTWVEQITGKDLAYESEQKFKLAKERALKALNDLGIEVTVEYLEMLIESFVYELNWEKHFDNVLGGDVVE